MITSLPFYFFMLTWFISAFGMMSARILNLLPFPWELANEDKRLRNIFLSFLAIFFAPVSLLLIAIAWVVLQVVRWKRPDLYEQAMRRN